ncbi:MAG TPA: hypothetical protein VES00_18185 [Burkholderiaceae bacterium]|jgi:hypothetical protein|nr:hypothetical protein [Burkholderiaceae bacterium]
MLVPQHPRPVSRRRAVAEMTVAAKQAAPIAPGHVLELPAVARPAEPPDAAAAPQSAGESPLQPADHGDTPS